MRSTLFLFLAICQLAVVSGASAQDDAGTDSGPLESLDSTMICMQRCSETHAMCVSTATLQDCMNNEPACADIMPRSSEIITAFCEACGEAADGCGPDEPVEPVAVPDPSSTARAAPAPLRSAADRERDARARARSICLRQRGIWDAETIVRMPDGTERQGVCRTPEGAELAQMITDEHDARVEADTDLDRRITAERAERTEAVRLLDERTRVRFFLESDVVNEMGASLERQLARLRCLELGAERVEYTTSAPVLHSSVERGYAGRWVDEGTRHVVFECPGNGRSGIEPIPSERTATSSSSGRAPHEHPTLFGEGWRPHLRIALLGWVGFTPLHPTLEQTRGELASTPVGVGFEVSLLASLSHGWYVEGGAGLTYDWPDFSPYATSARLWYHAGLFAYVIPELSLGFGYIGSDRFRPTMHSAHSFHGAYVEISLRGRLRLVERRLQSSPDVNDPAIVFTIRGAAGASIRPAVGTDPDGLIQALLGVEI